MELTTVLGRQARLGIVDGGNLTGWSLIAACHCFPQLAVGLRRYRLNYGPGMRCQQIFNKHTNPRYTEVVKVRVGE